MTSPSAHLEERLVRMLADIGPLTVTGIGTALSQRGTVVTDAAITQALRSAVELGRLERWPGRPARYAVRRAP